MALTQSTCLKWPLPILATSPGCPRPCCNRRAKVSPLLIEFWMFKKHKLSWHVVLSLWHANLSSQIWLMVVLEIIIESPAHVSDQWVKGQCKIYALQSLVWSNTSAKGQTGDIAIDDSAYIKSTEWQIASKTGTVHEVSYDCCPQIYQGNSLSGWLLLYYVGQRVKRTKQI